MRLCFLWLRLNRYEWRQFVCVCVCVRECVCVWVAHRDGRDSDSLHGGVGEQVPQGGACLHGDQAVGGVSHGGGEVFDGLSGHVLDHGVVLWHTNTNTQSTNKTRSSRVPDKCME